MRTFWLFRSNLRQYEYYHSIDNLEQFKKQCHDFYLLMGIWMLENTELEEFVVWRLSPDKSDNYKCSGKKVFEVNGKEFIQVFVDDFKDCFNFKEWPRPDITLFRGGFPEYGTLTNQNPGFFGLKLYLGAGQRVYPKHGGIYDKILIEDERDLHPNFDCIPFYKTANPNIFYPLDLEKKWDICWPCNFAQIKYKGQEWFIKQVANSEYLRSLKILHLGNKPEVGMDLCKKYGVNNIVFKGWVTRPELNKYLNQSKIGLVTSNELDGSPRVITEILYSGMPIIRRRSTRCPDSLIGWYTFKCDETDLVKVFSDSLREYEPAMRKVFEDVNHNEGHDFQVDSICQKNLELWK